MTDVRQYDAARQAMQDPCTRTLEQHAAHLRAYNSSNADQAAKRAYMLDHGLEYTNGTLGYAPSTVHREAAWEANQRSRMNLETYLDLTQRRAQEEAAIVAKRASERPLATSSGRVDGSSLAQQSHAPDKMFSRETIVAVIGAELVRRKLGAIPVPLSAAERVELEVEVTLSRLSRIFENLE